MDKQQVDIGYLKEELIHLKSRLERIEGFLASFPSTAVGVVEPSIPDELFLEAVKRVGEYDMVSASFFQRCLDIGYARSAVILDQLAKAELISSSDGTSKPRRVYRDKIQVFLQENEGND